MAGEMRRRRAWQHAACLAWRWPGRHAGAVASVRAALLQEILLALPAVGQERAARVLAAVRPATLDQIAHATRVDWLPAELHVELARAGLAALGEGGLKAWGRAAFGRSVRSSLLRPILEGAVRIFGLSPGAVLRAAPAAWLAAYREAGTLEVTPWAEHACRVTLRSLPPALQDRGFQVALAGALEGVFEACDAVGAARLLSTEAGETAEYEAAWQVGGA